MQVIAHDSSYHSFPWAGWQGRGLRAGYRRGGEGAELVSIAVTLVPGAIVVLRLVLEKVAAHMLKNQGSVFSTLPAGNPCDTPAGLPEAAGFNREWPGTDSADCATAAGVLCYEQRS
jgi:hypothetical protein